MIGTKLFATEFFAFADLATHFNQFEHVCILATFALCGFANRRSIGIQIGGIGALALVSIRTGLGIRALVGELWLVSVATVAGLFL